MVFKSSSRAVVQPAFPRAVAAVVVCALTLLTSCAKSEGDGGRRHKLWMHYRGGRNLLRPAPLKSDTINVIKHIEGEVYLGTNKGVSRWDGERFSGYGLSDGLGGEDVRWIVPVSSGVAAIGPWGMSVFDGRGWRKIKMPLDAPVSSAAAFKEEVVLLMERRIFVCDGNNCREVELSYLKGHRISAIYSASDGETLIALMHSRLLILRDWAEPDPGSERPYPAGVRRKDINGVAFGDHVWLGTGKGLFSLDESGKWHSYKTPILGLSGKYISSIAIAKDKLWLAGNKELSLTSERELLTSKGNWHATVYYPKNGLPNGEISALCSWNDQVWVGTNDRGAARLLRR